jgi:hypothetical protein
MSVNDVKVKKIPVMLDKERHLVFDLNAFCELEDKYGGQKEALEALNSGSFKAIRAFLWAGLLHEDENITEKQVGSWITMDNISEISDRITEAMKNALPEAKN